jgi:hypothetical protein
VVCFTSGAGATGNCYEAVTQTGDKFAALAAVSTKMEGGAQGRLVEINSPEEQAFLEANLPQIGGMPSQLGYWIGAHRVSPGVWAWDSGATMSYTNWNAGEPNGSGGNGGDEGMHIFGYGTYRWNDLPFTHSGSPGFIVEYENPVFSQVFESGANVDTWNPIFPPAVSPWTNSCTVNPAVGLNAAWENPHKAFSYGPSAQP